MNPPLWVVELSEQFWKMVGRIEPFPRELRSNISLTLPLTVREIPELTLACVGRWVERRGIPVEITNDDRPLRGALLVHDDAGFIFLDANDNDAEKRFTLAHELAHYLRDSWYPRRRAEKILGSVIGEVIDGRRPPTWDESILAIIRGVRVNFLCHLLDRDSVHMEAEENADRLAFELLAPFSELKSLTDEQTLRHDLVRRFGLSDALADRYVDLLRPESTPQNPWLVRLFS